MLERAARRLFNEAAPIDASGEGHPARIAAASWQLGFALRGYGKDGDALFGALGLDQPASSRDRKARKKEQPA